MIMDSSKFLCPSLLNKTKKPEKKLHCMFEITGTQTNKPLNVSSILCMHHWSLIIEEKTEQKTVLSLLISTFDSFLYINRTNNP